ncbi:MAG: transcriptional repressor LexA [Oligoflexia bacterium]
MSPKKLLITPKQKLFLEFLQSFEARHCYAPSQHEIAAHFGFKSLGTVQDYLKRLEEIGALRKTWNARRSTELMPKATAQLAVVTTTNPAHETASARSPLPISIPLAIPLLGRVAAGRPIEAASQARRELEIPPSLIPARFQKDAYALEVRGDSMIEDGIFDGDFVIIKRQGHAENGQTVVGLLNGSEATIKRYQRRGARIELHAANSKYAPILVEDDPEFRIEGILLALFRKY